MLDVCSGSFVPSHSQSPLDKNRIVDVLPSLIAEEIRVRDGKQTLRTSTDRGEDYYVMIYDPLRPQEVCSDDSDALASEMSPSRLGRLKHVTGSDSPGPGVT